MGRSEVSTSVVKWSVAGWRLYGKKWSVDKCSEVKCSWVKLKWETRRGHGCLVSCECCVLSGTGLCVRTITHPEKSYRMWCVWVWLWSLNNGEALAHWGTVSPWGGNKTSTADHYMHTWTYICIWSCVANRCTLYVHGLATAQLMVCKIRYLAMLHQLQKSVLTEMIWRLCTGLLCDIFEQLVQSTRMNGVTYQATITLTKEPVTQLMKQCWIICTGHT